MLASLALVFLFLRPAPNVGRDSLSYCNAITKTWVGGLILRPFTPTPVIPTTINCREFRPAPQGGRSFPFLFFNVPRAPHTLCVTRAHSGLGVHK